MFEVVSECFQCVSHYMAYDKITMGCWCEYLCKLSGRCTCVYHTICLSWCMSFLMKLFENPRPQTKTVLRLYYQNITLSQCYCRQFYVHRNPWLILNRYKVRVVLYWLSCNIFIQVYSQVVKRGVESICHFLLGNTREIFRCYKF